MPLFGAISSSSFVISSRITILAFGDQLLTFNEKLIVAFGGIPRFEMLISYEFEFICHRFDNRHRIHLPQFWQAASFREIVCSAVARRYGNCLPQLWHQHILSHNFCTRTGKWQIWHSIYICLHGFPSRSHPPKIHPKKDLSNLCLLPLLCKTKCSIAGNGLASAGNETSRLTALGRTQKLLQFEFKKTYINEKVVRRKKKYILNRRFWVEFGCGKVEVLVQSNQTLKGLHYDSVNEFVEKELTELTKLLKLTKKHWNFSLVGCQIIWNIIDWKNG